ncbi:uncharacterized protein LOC113212031 [Frankliniella occidentalis]|uniref:Uncharacterized protein LOC113212031 n=1 Tax=Frankliniella occidentalis TaxID=133901 RepID=A0A6J1SZM2_FRAOC|nr:uncharacterized protein LOC113212031 [Frankliniella occidentalis]
MGQKVTSHMTICATFKRFYAADVHELAEPLSPPYDEARTEDVHELAEPLSPLSRDEFWLVPRRAVIDPCFCDYNSFSDFAEDPFFREPAMGADVVVDLGDVRVYRLASCMYMPENRSVRMCGLHFLSCDRQEVMDYFHTCHTLALSSAHPDTDDPDFIKDWLQREDQDEIAKSRAETADMSERMVWTTNRLRFCAGQTVVYVPADDSPTEMRSVPTDGTPVKFYPSTMYSTKETARVQLKF